MSKISKVVLASTLALTGIVGLFPVNISKANVADSQAEVASITPQQTYADAKKGQSAKSSNINGAGQYGRINLTIENNVTSATARVMKVVSWGFDQEIASVSINYEDSYNGIRSATKDVWLESGTLYYIELNVSQDQNASAGLSNYTW